MITFTFDEITAPLVYSEQYKNLGLFLRENDFVNIAKGSNTKYHAWEGGFVDHCRQIAALMRRSICDADTFGIRADFSDADAFAAIVGHDFEKIFKYSTAAAHMEYQALKDDGEDSTVFIRQYFNKIHVYPSDAVWNAIQYAHGEHMNYNPHFSVAHQLATHLHSADWLSSRIYKHQDGTFQPKN